MNLTGTTAILDKIHAGNSDVPPQNIITFGKNGVLTLESQNINATQKTTFANMVAL
jgi:hypothetical protein